MNYEGSRERTEGAASCIPGAQVTWDPPAAGRRSNNAAASREGNQSSRLVTLPQELEELHAFA